MGKVYQDGEGNKLIVHTNGLVQMRLYNEIRVRNIGWMENRKYCKHEDSIFMKFNAFGFNHAVIRILNPQVIEVEYQGDIYRINRDSFEKCKKFLHFKKKGYELRCYVPLEDFERV